MSKMNKQISFLLPALFLIVSAAFSEGWKHLNPPSGPTIITDITTMGDYQFALVHETSSIKTIYRREVNQEWWTRIFSDTLGGYSVHLGTFGYNLFYDNGIGGIQYSPNFGRLWRPELSFDPYQTVFFGDTLLRIWTNYTNLSDDGGKNWTGLPDFYAGPVNCITYGETKAYIGGWGGIAALESDLQWIFLDNGLPERENITAIGELNDSVLVVSTEKALYRSENAGSSWSLLDSTICIPLSITGKIYFAVSENRHYMSTETDIYELTNDGHIQRKLDTGFRMNKPLYAGISFFKDTLYTSGYDGVYKYLKSSDTWKLSNKGIDRSNIITEAFAGGNEIFVTSITGLHTTGIFASRHIPMYSSVFAMDQKSGEWRIVLDDDCHVEQFAVIGDKYFATLRHPDSADTIKLVSENKGQSWNHGDFPDLSPHKLSVYGNTAYSWNEGFLLRSTDTFSSWEYVLGHDGGFWIDEFLALGKTLLYGYHYMGAHVSGGGSKISHDWGETWDELSDANVFAYTKGQLLYRKADSLYTSSDSGLTWKQTIVPEDWPGITGFTNSGIIFGHPSSFSLDQGVTWEPIYDPEGNLFDNFGLHIDDNDMMYTIDAGVYFAKPASSLGTVSKISRSGVYSVANIPDVSHIISGNMLSIRLNIPQRKSGYHISIHNLKGSCIRERSGTLDYGLNQIDFDCSDIAHALYLLNIRTGDEQFSKRLVVGP